MEECYFDITQRLTEACIPTYAGCRIAAIEQAQEVYGIPIDEIIAKIDDETILRAIHSSMEVMGIYSMLEDEKRKEKGE